MNEQPQKKNNQPEVDCFSSGGQRPQKKKLGRPFGKQHRNINFGVSTINDEPVVLHPPEGYIPLSVEEFKYIISKQTEWRHEYLLSKKTNANYQRNKPWLKEYFKNYNNEYEG